jgi:hypothetical protein
LVLLEKPRKVLAYAFIMIPELGNQLILVAQPFQIYALAE